MKHLFFLLFFAANLAAQTQVNQYVKLKKSDDCQHYVNLQDFGLSGERDMDKIRGVIDRYLEQNNCCIVKDYCSIRIMEVTIDNLVYFPYFCVDSVPEIWEAVGNYAYIMGIEKRCSYHQMTETKMEYPVQHIRIEYEGTGFGSVFNLYSCENQSLNH